MEKVFQYPALKDNYNWVITCPETRECAGVDIYEPEPFFSFIEKNNLKPVAVLNTHHHWDHTGGNEAVAEKFPGLKFYGSAYDYTNKRISCQNSPLAEGEQVAIGNIALSVLEIPGHTLGHICYYNEEMAFVGDTLFASGCGRLFEGSAEQMSASLEKLVQKIPRRAKIYCGHEYTLSNLDFASSLNAEYFRGYHNEIKKLREENKMTVPTDMNKELKYNPFLMVRDEAMKNEVLKLEGFGKVEAFAHLRKRKDNF